MMGIRWPGDHEGARLKERQSVDMDSEILMKKQLTCGDHFLLNSGLHCPKCKGANLTSGDFSGDGPKVEAKTECEDCGALWIEIYSLTGMQAVSGFDPSEPASTDEGVLEVDGRLSDAERQVIEGLRERGFAITMFNPSELGAADSRGLENALVEAGNEAIGTLSAQ